VFSDSASYLSSMQADLAREMMRAEAGVITKSHIEKMRILARNSVVAFTQVFADELREEFGDFNVGSPVDDLPATNDTSEITREKQQRRAIRLILTLLRELVDVSKSTYTHKTLRFSDDTMTTEELFTFDFARVVRSRLETIADVLRELRSANSERSILGDLTDLEWRCDVGDPFAIFIAAEVLRRVDNRPSITRLLATQLGASEGDALRILDRIEYLSNEITRMPRVSLSECIELSKYAFVALSQLQMEAQ